MNQLVNDRSKCTVSYHKPFSKRFGKNPVCSSNVNTIMFAFCTGSSQAEVYERINHLFQLPGSFPILSETLFKLGELTFA